MTSQDLKVSLRNEERLDVCFYGPREENPISALITLWNQVSYRVSDALNISDMPTTLGIYISIIIVCEFRDVSFEDFQDCSPLRNIDFHINLVIAAQSIFRAPIMWPLAEFKELKI